MHKKCIAHRDIKPENIIITKDEVLVKKKLVSVYKWKLIDFGVSDNYNDKQEFGNYTIKGTPSFYPK